MKADRLIPSVSHEISIQFTLLFIVKQTSGDCRTTFPETVGFSALSRKFRAGIYFESEFERYSPGTALGE